MSFPRIIGIAGRKGAGKDTLADYFVREHNYTKLAFATPLKEALKERFNLSEADFAPEEKEEPAQCFGFRAIPYDVPDSEFGPDFSLRSWMQWLGTDFARKLFGEDCWVKLMLKQIETSPHTHFVISDVRFENEAKFIRELGGVIIHIVRPAADADGHSSEKGLQVLENDLAIFNDGSVAELEEAAAELFAPAERHHATTWGTGWQDYIEFINSTWVEDQRDEVAHAAFGLVEEAGEVGGLFKRVFRGDTVFVDYAKLKKELGDVIYYWTKVCELHGFDPEEVIAGNVEKILNREKRGQLRGSGDER